MKVFVEKLINGWCKYASYLNNASISSANQHFKFLDEKHQIIIGKSDITESLSTSFN